MTKEQIAGPDYSKILYIAPSPLNTREAQCVFHTIAGDCYIPPAFMTFSQLSHRLFTRFASKQIVSDTFIPIILSRLTGKHMGFATMLANFMHELKRYYPGKSAHAIETSLRMVFERLGIPDDVVSRSSEALKLIDRYQKTLEEHDAVDELDAMAGCPELIRTHGVSWEILIVDGFIDPTPIEREIIRALVERARYTLISIPYDNDYHMLSESYISFLDNNFNIVRKRFPVNAHPPDIPYQRYPDAEAEIEGIARLIKARFLSGEAPDLDRVFVVFPESMGHLARISRVFRKYGLPFTTFTNKPLVETQPVRELLALLVSVADDYPRLPFSQFLTSRSFKSLPSLLRTVIPTLSIFARIPKGKSAWMSIVQSNEKNRLLESLSNTDLRAVRRQLTSVLKKLSPLESRRSCASFAELSALIEDLLRDFGFSSATEHPDDTMTTIVEMLRKLAMIDRFAAADSDLNTFISSLRHALAHTALPDSEQFGVRVASFREAYGIEPDYLYFGGLRDGDFPVKPSIDYFLPDSVRREIGLTEMRHALLRQKFQFRRMVASARRSSLSYSTMDGDRVFLPSSVLSWNSERPEHVPGIFSREEALVLGEISHPVAPSPEISVTSKRTIERMFGTRAFMRVTDIDSYRSCPRKFFIERVLALAPLEIKQFELEPLVLGSIIHEIMSVLLLEPITDLHTFTDRAKREIDALLSKKPLDAYWKNVVRESFLSILPEIYDLERRIADDGFLFSAAEIPVKGEVLPGIRLKGTIDRIDRRISPRSCQAPRREQAVFANESHSPETTGNDVVELIDYKTGSTQFSGTQVSTRGASLQLPLYAALVQLQGCSVERIGIYNLKDISLTWLPNRNDRKNSRTVGDYVKTALRFLEETVTRMRNGDFAALPLTEQSCRNCAERPYCPFIQKATTT